MNMYAYIGKVAQRLSFVQKLSEYSLIGRYQRRHKLSAKKQVSLSEMTTLSFEEAAALTGLGEKLLRGLAERRPDLCIKIGRNTRLKRIRLEEFIDNASYI